MNTDLGTLGEIAERTGGRVIGDASVRVGRIAAIDDVDATALTFATDERFFRLALASRALAVLVDATLIDPAAAYEKPLVAVASPRLALSSLLAVLETPRPRGPFVHASAIVAPSAVIGADVYIGALAVIGDRATIGDRTVLLAGAILGEDVRVGADCLLHERSFVGARCVIGDRVILQPQAIVGGDGFGWAFLEGALLKIPQVGIVELADDVEIGAGSCVDRAQTGVTSIGTGTKIDNLVQIGHNCRIGKHCAIAALTGLAGSTTLGDYVQVGGQVGFGGHLTVGSRAVIAGRAEVWGDIDAGATVSGAPARPHRENLLAQAYLRRLPKLTERVEALEKSRALDHPDEH